MSESEHRGPFDFSTVTTKRETHRIMVGVTLRDAIELGEEVARFEPGVSLTEMRKTIIRLAMESRGVDFSLDVFCHKGIWERFLHVSYEPSWKIDPETGIILERPDTQQEHTSADTIRAERQKFETARDKRKVLAARRANRGAGKVTKTAESH